MLEATQYRPEFTLASLEHLVGPLDFDLDHGMIYRVPDLESIDFDIDSRMSNHLPTVSTSTAHGLDLISRPYISEKGGDRIYVRREILMNETFLMDISPILGRHGCWRRIGMRGHASVLPSCKNRLRCSSIQMVYSAVL